MTRWWFVLLILPLSSWASEFSDDKFENLAQVLCAPNDFFATCYSLPRKKCEADFKSFLSQCAKMRLDEKVEARLALGQCAGSKFDEANRNAASTDGVCAKADAW